MKTLDDVNISLEMDSILSKLKDSDTFDEVNKVMNTSKKEQFYREIAQKRAHDYSNLANMIVGSEAI